MNRRVIAERLYDRSARAQAYRRSRLTPDAVRAYLGDWAERGMGFGAELAAIGLIEMTAMLECPAAERVKLIDRILDMLAEINDEPAS